MNEWFQDFVNEVADALRDSIELVRESQIVAGSLDNQAICKAGENLVEYILSKKGYTVALPPASRTPGDVWGLREYPLDELYYWWHLIQVQVKATASSDKPEELKGQKLEETKRFPAFIEDILLRSTVVPKEIKISERVISIGYAGVLVDPKKYEPIDYNACYINHKTSEGLTRYGDLILSKVSKVHELIIPRPFRKIPG